MWPDTTSIARHTQAKLENRIVIEGILFVAPVRSQGFGLVGANRHAG